MDFNEIEKLMHALEKSTLSRIAIKEGGFELELEKHVAGGVTTSMQMAPQMVPVAHHTQATPQAIPQAKEEPKGKYITSPMVGTFYATPSPEEPSFVKEGDLVEEMTVVCIIEAMKVMNEVKAGVQGKIAEILVKNGEPVEFGTKIFRVI